MPFVETRFISPTTLTTSAASALYTVPTGYSAIIKQLVVTNITGTAATFTFYIGATASASNALFSGTSVAANDTVIINLSQVLSTGETLRALASTGSALNLTVSGVINDGPLASTATYIADGAITTAKIADSAIVTVDIANTAVTSAKLADSLSLTGTPTAPTAAVDTNTTQLATTAYVVGQGYAKLANPTFSGTVSGITKTMVGLGSVDNTADTAKPVSTAQQTALNLKANLSAPTFTGNVTISSGNLITGSRPSFYVVHAAGNDLVSGTQVFTNVQSNIGSCYNSSNGRFTATIAGQYQFQGKLLSTNSANLSCELRKNNSYVQYSEMSRTGNNFIEISFVAVITLAVGDYMTIYSPVNVYGYAYSNFSGFFIG
jgi:hypothetical protein